MGRAFWNHLGAAAGLHLGGAHSTHGHRSGALGQLWHRGGAAGSRLVSAMWGRGQGRVGLGTTASILGVWRARAALTAEAESALCGGWRWAPHLGRELSGAVWDSWLCDHGKFFPFPGPQVLVCEASPRPPALGSCKGLTPTKGRRSPGASEVCAEP